MNIIEKIKNAFSKKSYYGYATVNNQVNALSWNSTKYLKAYETSAYVYACVKKRAEKVGEIEFELFNAKGEQVYNSPVLNLLYKPNPLMTKNEFFELYQIYKDLAGTAYIYTLRVGTQVKEMYLLRPDWVTKVNIDKETGLPSSYEYQTPNGKTKKFEASDIIVSKYPSPLDALTGQSPLKAGALAVDTEEQLARYHYSVLKNGGKVEGIINYSAENLTKDQIREIREMFSEQYSGANNSAKPLVTYGGATYQNLGLNPSELSYIESKKMTRDDILLIYGVPKVIVAQTDDVNYANAKVGREVFLSETIRPLLTQLVQKLNEFLVPENLNLSFDDPTPEDIDTELKKIESGIKNYYLTPNEVRDKIGLDPIDGGDSLLIPFNLMPMDNSNLDEVTPTKEVKKKEINHPLRSPEFRAKYYANFLEKASRRESKFLRALKGYLKAQRDRVINSLTATTIKQKDIIDEILSIKLETGLARETLMPILMEYLRESGDDAMALVGSNYKFNVNAKIQSIIDKRVDLFTASITDTTVKQLKTQLKESLANGESLKELENRIKDTYNGISKKRASVIARTETQVATQTGQFEGYKQSGVGIKIWVHSAGVQGGIRDEHAGMDGEEQPIDMPFSNGLMMPCDPSGSAEETINCMCSI